ncbi:MAG: methylenetetrahydrofolate reductase [NAD(P)H] [Bacteroidetes bacterium GWF2_38_335]|nr:MAG: methylenetetrahydrofolate reductase [NAD(P)H] [Bacteroidetes bacterium GWF2_38_335]OFY79402.1 MAG: methylenetetrahydrofolate reductase [NAD(P)H] [Bacteroidetes bacterium RIFOXYA12_FULL_38_20]HBS85666.1 methylenetetrahydrofolate reductase [NAD(P)H] [Bacteroidales bacterium]
MKVINHIKNAQKTQFSFEILPPEKGANIQEIYDTIDPLMEFKPPYINVTYHKEEVVYKKHPNGLLEPRTVKKRPGTVGISAAIKFKYDVIIVPHIICGGFSMEETENALIDLHFLGINNLLVVRGDADKTTRSFVPDPNGHANAIDLIRQIKRMNDGKYVDDDLIATTPTDFSMGVAGYPEKHNEAPNMDSDIRHLKAKVDAGADYIVTQMFFDNQKFYDFVKRCREAGITVPIIPGLKPMSIKAHLNILPQTFHIDLPEILVKEIEKCETNAEVRQVGIEWGIMQSKDLIKNNVPIIHYFTMGKSDNIRRIAEGAF